MADGSKLIFTLCFTTTTHEPVHLKSGTVKGDGHAYSFI
jgi:hypothetical protein